jgi:hypothetical protein
MRLLRQIVNDKDNTMIKLSKIILGFGAKHAFHRT